MDERTRIDESPLQRAVRLLGGGVSMGEKLGVTKSAVSQWGATPQGVPLDRCLQIERLTEGLVTCEELRPDLADEFAFLRRGAEKVVHD